MEEQNTIYVYVGYVINDYADPLWMSRDKAKVQKEIDDYKTRGSRSTFIKRYVLSRNNLIDLDCD